MEAYFDNSATTKVLDCVKDAVVDAMCVNYGNAAAKHRKGVEAENLIREAKKAIADTLKVQEKEILFTSGGTESNNTALIGTALANRRAGKHLITTGVEHPSIYNTMSFLEEMGFEVTYIRPTSEGYIRPEDVELVAPEEGIIHGTLTHSIFKGVHYEMEVMANGFEWLVQSTKMVPVGTKVGIKVDPFNIQIMKKPESEDEEAIGVNE